MNRSMLTFFRCVLAVFIMAAAVIPASAKVIEGFSDVSRMTAAEGVVLLKNPSYTGDGKVNENNTVLPIKNGEMISIFGIVQDYYYSNGTGSGGGVSGINVDHITTIADGLRNNPAVKVNEELAAVYKQWIKSHPFRENGGWTNNVSWSQVEMPLSNDVVSKARTVSDAAIVIIGRTAGEDHEGAYIKGSYLLTDTEIDMLNKVNAAFDRVVIVLNTGGIIDMSWMKDYPNAAIVYGWQGGMEGGSATADVLTGFVTPCGKLVDTIAESLECHSAHGNHTTEMWNSLKYEEDIYVGYRYFETFAPDKIVYPFGYGLSYTTFNTNTDKVRINDKDITIAVTVKNTGKVKGKEVVQVYYGAPQGKLGKPVKQLAAFAKTGVLYPGESQKITLSFNTEDMASYDDSGITGHDSCYVMEAGDYNIYVGTDAHTCKEEGVYKLKKTKVVQQLSEVLAPTRPLRRMRTGALKADGAYELVYEDVPQRSVDYNQRILDNLPDPVERLNEKKYRLVDVYNGKTSLDTFVGQFTDHDLAAVIIGEENNDASRGTTGAAGCFGAVTKSLKDLGLPLAIAADGPAGIRVNKSVKVTSLPCGTMIACSWNLGLVEQLYNLLGKELVLNNVDSILGPGVDIHRYPLGGRNFEYFSEDPLVVGMIACASARGIQKEGVTPTIKHFAANNLEKARREINSCISERALREIYLRGFQIAVENGNVASIMSSYNPINGTWTSSSYDLNTIVLRDEWGFEGIVMTDWWSKLGDDQAFYTRDADGQKGAAMNRAQQDLFMRKDQGVVERDLGGMDQLKALHEGKLTVGELQRTAKNICSYLLKSAALARLEGFDYVQKYVAGPDKFIVKKDVAPGNPLISKLAINGRSIRADIFNPLKLEYKVFHGLGNYPVITASGQAGVKVSIDQASSARNAAVITASKGKEERVYKVIFTDEPGLEPLLENANYAYLKEIEVGGSKLNEFSPANFYYTIGFSSDELPSVKVKVANDVKAFVTNDPANKQVTVRCVSADQANVYMIQFGKKPVSDEFTSVNKAWTIINESEGKWKLDSNSGILSITAERGDFWRGNNNLKNFFQQDAFGNWQATVKVTVNAQPTRNYQSIGPVAFEDLDNYIFMKYEYSNGPVIGMFKENKGNDPLCIGKIDSSELKGYLGDAKTVFFRIKKIGNTYTGSVSIDGSGYRILGRTAAVYEEPKFGLLAVTGSEDPAGDFHADYDFVKFDHSPVVAPVVLSGAETVLKVAETEPVAVSAIMMAAKCDDVSGGLCYTLCEKGESVSYRVNVGKSGSYKLAARYKASNSNPLAQMAFTVYDGDKMIKNFSYIKSTNGNWVTQESEDFIKLTAGEHEIRIVFETAGIDLNWLRFKSGQ